MRLAIIMSALALAGCTAGAEMQASQQARAQADLAKALEGRVAGKPAECISDSATGSRQVIDRRTILYTEGRRVWRNDLPEECPRLSPFGTMVVEVRGSQLCRNDLFRVFEPGTTVPGAYCRLGKFTPYTRP